MVHDIGLQRQEDQSVWHKLNLVAIKACVSVIEVKSEKN